MERDVCRVTGDVRVAGRNCVALGLAPRFNAVEKIANMERRRIAADFVNLPAGEQFG